MADIGIKIRATDEASGVFSKVASEAGKLQSEVGSLRDKFAALAGSAVLGLSALSFANQIKETINMADSFNKLSQKTGIAVEELSKLNYAAGLADLSTESLGKGLNKFNVNISAAAAGSKEQAALFKALGVSVKDAAGNVRSADSVLGDVATKFAESADGANKLAVAASLFGQKVGSEFIPLLNTGKGGLKDMGDEAKKLGIVLGADFARNAEEFNDNMRKMNLAGQGLTVTIAGGMVSAFGAAASEAARVAVESGKLAGIWAGLKVAIGGSDQNISDRNIIDLVDKQLAAENALLAARRNGNAAFIKSREDYLAGINAEIKTTQSYRKELEDLEKAKIKAAGPKTTTDSKPIKDAAGVIGAGGAAKTTNEYQRLSEELNKQLELMDREIELGRKLTDSEKFRIESIDKITEAYVKGGSAAKKWREEQEGKANLIADRKQQFEDTQRLIKSEQAAAEAHNKYVFSLNEGLDKLREETIAQQEHIDRLGLSVTAIAELDAAKLESQAVIQDLIVLKKMEQGLDVSQYDIYVKTSEELRKQAALKRTGAAKEVQIESAKEVAKAAEEEWKRGWESTDQLAREVFTNWAEDGSSAAKKIGDTLKKALLSAVYEATLKPLVFQVFSSVTGGAPGAMGSLGSAVGAANGVAQAGSLAALGGTFGSSLSAGFSATVSSFGAATGVAIEGGLASIATGTSTAIASGLGQIAGALGPYALAAVALAKLFEKGEYVKSTGSSVQYFDAKGAVTSKSTLSNNFATNEADAYVKGIKDAYSALSKQLGVANAGGMFAFASNNSEGGKAGVQVAVGKANYSTGEFKATDEALKLEASRAVFAALQGSDLPGYLAKVFDGITASSATAEQINQTLGYASALKTVRDALVETRTPLQALKDSVADSFKALSTNADTFKTDFVAAIDNGIAPEALADWQKLGAGMEQLAGISKTAADELASTNARLQDRLDLLTGAATERSIELRDTTDASSRAILEQIYAQQDLKTAQQAAVDASRQAASDYSAIAADQQRIAAERSGLQDQLDAATMSNAQLLEKQRNALDASNVALFDQVQAANAAKKANDDLAASQDRIAAERLGLQGQLDQLTLTSVELVAKQRASLDASNQALFDQIQAATVANAAKAEAEAASTKAAQEALAKATNIANERLSLQDQYDALTLSSIALLDKQRNALDASNVALFDQVQAATAAKKAQEELATTQARIAAERTGLQDQLDNLTLNSAQLLDKQRNALDASNRALFDQVRAATSAAAALSAFKTTMESLGSTRSSLQVQLLTAQGNPAGALALKRKTELDLLTNGKTAADAALISAAYNANTALEDQITATNEAAQAAKAMAEAQAQAAQQAAQAAKQLKDAWQDVSNSMFDEVARLRGLMGKDSAQSFAQLQSDFTLTTAQARAGDQSAAKLLPQLSRQLEAMGIERAASLTDEKRIQGQIAASLELTASILAKQYGLSLPNTMPQFAAGGYHLGGVRLVGENGPEVEATGPARIYSASQTAAMLRGGGQSNNGDVVLAIATLERRLETMQDQLDTANEQLLRICTDANPETVRKVRVLP